MDAVPIVREVDLDGVTDPREFDSVAEKLGVVVSDKENEIDCVCEKESESDRESEDVSEIDVVCVRDAEYVSEGLDDAEADADRVGADTDDDTIRVLDHDDLSVKDSLERERDLDQENDTDGLRVNDADPLVRDNDQETEVVREIVSFSESDSVAVNDNDTVLESDTLAENDSVGVVEAVTDAECDKLRENVAVTDIDFRSVFDEEGEPPESDGDLDKVLDGLLREPDRVRAGI